jgi:16S rRNA (guanine527-N7)-methyltransferase
MTESEAQDWLRGISVPRETMDRLEAFIALLTEEMPHQNLIAASTLPHIWNRHIADSAQLLPLAMPSAQSWLDLGSGAGLPGIVLALLNPALHITLVESRRKRIDFLQRTAETLGLLHQVKVAGARLETMEAQPFDIISARAFAPLVRLLPLAHRFSTAKTRWLLPKGQSAASELAAAQGSWQGSFRVVPSVTDPDAAIIVAEQVQPKGRRR